MPACLAWTRTTHNARRTTHDAQRATHTLTHHTHTHPHPHTQDWSSLLHAPQFSLNAHSGPLRFGEPAAGARTCPCRPLPRRCRRCRCRCRCLPAPPPCQKGVHRGPPWRCGGAPRPVLARRGLLDLPGGAPAPPGKCGAAGVGRRGGCQDSDAGAASAGGGVEGGEDYGER
eukprot:303564-Chlamydomonas_euryale.AAC.1